MRGPYQVAQASWGMCSRQWGAAASSLLPGAVMKLCPTTDQTHRGVQCSAVVH